MTGVYIHGTNGAGKTTLARALMVCAGGITVECTIGDAQMTVVDFRAGGCGPLVFVGKYRTATGGFDTCQPYAAGVDAAIARAQEYGNNIVMESLITPGTETCKKLASGIGDVTFFWLDVPLERCIAQMNERRAARGSEPLEDVSNVQKKAASVESWHRRLHEAGLKVERGDWDYVFARCRKILGLNIPSERELLS